MKTILGTLFGLAALSAIPASATLSPLTFDFTNCTASSTCSNGYSSATPYSETVNGVTVTAQAYYSTTGATSSALSSNATVGVYSNAGLGVCSGGDNATSNCSAPSHQVDNMNTSTPTSTGNSYDFILFTFTSSTTHLALPVTLTSLQLANYGSTGQNTGPIDMDMTYWLNPTSTSVLPTGAGTNIFCGDPTNPANQQACAASQTGMDDTINGTGVTSILVGAYTGGTNTSAGAVDSTPDYFKIQGITLGTTTQVSSTPEPATFGLIGLSLAGLGLARRKRKTN